MLAKEVASLAKLSEGRLLLGVGAGWLEEEFDALGVPFARRGARLDDTIRAMRVLWSEDRATYEGEFVSFHDAVSLPKPPGGTVPVIIGGHTEAAARRAGRLGDGFFPGKGDADELGHLLDIMRNAAIEAGRDPGTIEITAGTTAVFLPDPLPELQQLADLGVARVVIPPLAFSGDQIGDALAGFGDKVISRFR